MGDPGLESVSRISELHLPGSLEVASGVACVLKSTHSSVYILEVS